MSPSVDSNKAYTSIIMHINKKNTLFLQNTTWYNKEVVVKNSLSCLFWLNTEKKQQVAKLLPVVFYYDSNALNAVTTESSVPPVIHTFSLIRVSLEIIIL